MVGLAPPKTDQTVAAVRGGDGGVGGGWGSNL